MVELLREGMAAGAIGLSSGVFYATGAAADVDELALLAGIAGAAGGIYTTHIRNEMNDIFRCARRSIHRSAAWQRAGSHLPSQMRRDRKTGAAPYADFGPHRCGAREAAHRTRCLPLYVAGLHRPACRPDRRDHRRCRHVIGAASGNGGAAPGRYRCRVELHAARSLRTAAARRRLLLPDARGRCAARAALPGHDDRLGRPAARSSSPSPPVGNLSSRSSATTAAISHSSRSRPPFTR